ncbi:MAG: rod-binding protein [Gemmatimonadota bacterium]
MTAPIGGTPRPAPGSPEAKLRHAASELESVFYGQLFQAMRDASPEGGAIETSSAEKMFTTMLDDKISRLAAGQTNRGLAEAMYRQLSKNLPVATTAPGNPPSAAGRLDVGTK